MKALIQMVTKKVLALLLGLISGVMIAALLGLGIEPEQVAEAMEHFEAFLGIAITGGLYFMFDFLLSKIKKFFPAEWAEQFWKVQAGEQVKSLQKETAKRRIEEGRI